MCECALGCLPAPKYIHSSRPQNMASATMTIGSQKVQDIFVFKVSRLKKILSNNPRNRVRISCAASQGGKCATNGCGGDILNENNLTVNIAGTRALCHNCHMEGTRGPKSESWKKAQRVKKVMKKTQTKRVKRKIVHDIRAVPTWSLDAALDAEFDAVLKESMRLFVMSTHVHWDHPVKYNLVGAKRQRL